MPTKTTNLTLALAISSVLNTSAQATPAIANQTGNLTLSNASLLLASSQTALDAFWDGKYTYCDAKLLAAYWGQSIYEAKARAGEKLLRGERSVVGDFLSSARSRAPENGTTCTFDEEGYSYDDAALLAKYWGKPTPWDAKLKINRLLMSGNNAAVQKALQSAKQQNQSTQPQPANLEQQQWDKYSASEYNFEDAKRLARYWGKSTPWEAKLKIGSLLLSGNNVAVQKDLQRAKRQKQSTQQPANTEQQQMDKYSASEYNFEDAERLARFWGKSTTWDAKLKIGSLLLSGNDVAIKKALKNAKQQ
jgi:hypothetical protein